AGQKPVSREEFIRLQQLVIDSPRFTKMGFREQGGFIGEHDRRYGTPMPDHISARWEDVLSLVDGLIATDQKLENDEGFDAVIVVRMISFEFLFIHPLVDGYVQNQLYLIHQV